MQRCEGATGRWCESPVRGPIVRQSLRADLQEAHPPQSGGCHEYTQVVRSAVGRVQDGKVLLDLRTVFERQEDELFEAIRTGVL